jgi:hypothetical protein
MSHSAAQTGSVREAMSYSLQFLPDFKQVLEGDLKGGGRITVEYAADARPVVAASDWAFKSDK